MESNIQISVAEGLRISPATLFAVDMVYMKHSCCGSTTLSDVIATGMHWIKVLLLNTKLPSSAIKSSPSEKIKITIYVISISQKH